MTKDHNGFEYPSREGAYAQMVECILDSSFEGRWYSFDEIALSTNSGSTIKGIRAISRGEDGEEDQTYDFWWA